MKLVTNKLKSGRLHEKHIVTTWNFGSHLIICLQTQGNQEKPVSRWPIAGPSEYWLLASSPSDTTICLLYCFNTDIVMLTAAGLTPDGSSTVHIYTQTIHRTTKLTTLFGRLSGIRTKSGQNKINDELLKNYGLMGNVCVCVCVCTRVYTSLVVYLQNPTMYSVNSSWMNTKWNSGGKITAYYLHFKHRMEVKTNLK